MSKQEKWAKKYTAVLTTDKFQCALWHWPRVNPWGDEYDEIILMPESSAYLQAAPLIRLLYLNPADAHKFPDWFRALPKHPDYFGYQEPVEPPRPDLPDWVQVGAEFTCGRGTPPYRVTALVHEKYPTSVACQQVKADGTLNDWKQHCGHADFRSGTAKQYIPWQPTLDAKVKGKAGADDYRGRPIRAHDYGRVIKFDRSDSTWNVIWYKGGEYVDSGWYKSDALEAAE